MMMMMKEPADPLMQAIRTLGRLPEETRKATKDERQLAEELHRARRAGKLSGEEEAELAAMSANDSEPAAMSANDSLMQAIRCFGRLPKDTRKATKDERQLAEKLRQSRRAGKLGVEEEAELAAMSANELGTLEEADAYDDEDFGHQAEKRRSTRHADKRRPG